MASKKNKTLDAALDCSLSQDCLDYLKINKQPFAADILTENTFLNSPELDKIIENLRHQVQFSELLLIIEGPFGSGKTSLFRHLTRSEIETTKLLPIQAEATDTLVQIQQKMSFHLQELGNASYLDENLKSLQSFDQIPLVIIDNTHVLSDTTIQELFRYKDQLKQDQNVNLKLILFASDGIANTLQKITSLQENKMYVQRMPIYSSKLASDFIFHKLRIAGYSGESLLSEKDYQLADKKSDGTALNLMYHIAKIIEANVAKKLKPPMPLWVKGLVGLAAVIIISTATSIYLGLFDTKQIVTEIDQTTEPFSSIEAAPPGIEIEDNIPASAESDETAPETIDSSMNETKPAIVEDEPEQSVAIENTAEETNSLEDNISISTLTPEQQVVASEPLSPSPEPALDETPATTETPVIKPQAIEAVTAKTTEKKVPPVIKTVTTSQPSPQETNPALMQLNKMGMQDADWLLTQKNSDWTLQLLGARDPETLLTFAQQHKLSNEAAWYKTWLKQQPYYVIVYGHFSSRDNARAAIAKLPEKLRTNRPWVKSMKSVKDAIK